jgi:hypothetical protein
MRNLVAVLSPFDQKRVFKKLGGSRIGLAMKEELASETPTGAIKLLQEVTQGRNPNILTDPELNCLKHHLQHNDEYQEEFFANKGPNLLFTCLYPASEVIHHEEIYAILIFCIKCLFMQQNTMDDLLGALSVERYMPKPKAPPSEFSDSPSKSRLFRNRLSKKRTGSLHELSSDLERKSNLSILLDLYSIAVSTPLERIVCLIADILCHVCALPDGSA